MKRQLIKDILKSSKETVKIAGWVANIRDHGKLIFLELRDWSATVQLVINEETSEAFAKAKELGLEYVISATGKLVERDSKTVKNDSETGNVEFVVESLEILNPSKNPPFPLSDDGRDINENLRLQYRYIDLRRKRVKNLLVNRHKFIRYTRNWFADHEFTEIETPLLTVSSPEGARDFLVPSRIYPGKFFALPQAPQQYKQLLMVGGIHRYFQIAPCMRDEDPRADRHSGAFYQIDVECSFIETDEEFFSIVEPYFKDVVKELTDKKVKYEEFPKIKYNDAWNIYGSDKPDLRFELKLVDVTNELKKSGMNIFANVETAKAILVDKVFSRKEIDELTEDIKKQGAAGLAYMFIENGVVSGGISKNISEDTQKEIIEQCKHSGYEVKGSQTILFVAGKHMPTCKQAGWLRSKMGDILNLKDPNTLAFAWIVDFDMFEWNESENRWDFMHNPFSMPKGGMESLKNLSPDKITAQQYDLACNGYEVASGSIRNHDPKILVEAFKICGYTEEYTRSKFGHMISAFEYGAPPHGGFAPGVDRLMMILFDESNIREVYAFPQTNGQELMIGSPREVETKDLDILGIELKDKGREVVTKIKERLDSMGIEYKYLEHEEVRTSEEAAAIRGLDLSTGSKAMVLKSLEYDNKLIMVVIPANKQLSLDKVSDATGEKFDVAGADLVEKYTGLKVGGIPPFGRLLKMEVYFDKSIKDKETVAFNCGMRTASIIMSGNELVEAAQPNREISDPDFTS